MVLKIQYPIHPEVITINIFFKIRMNLLHCITFKTFILINIVTGYMTFYFYG